MTLISSIITDAFREGNILPLGKAPNANQAAEALRLFNSCIAALYGDEAGESLTDWPLGNYGRESPEYDLGYTDHRLDHPTINRRLIAVNETAKTVYFPLRPQDGARKGDDARLLACLTYQLKRRRLETRARLKPPDSRAAARVARVVVGGVVDPVLVARREPGAQVGPTDIEERAQDEVLVMPGRLEDGTVVSVSIAAPGSPAGNPAFDVTPARLVTGFITERGIAPASRAGLLGLYPERA